MSSEAFLWWAFGFMLTIAVIRPLFWWVALSLSLWIGRLLLNDRWGRIVFGRYWRPNRSISISDMLNGIEPRPSNEPTLADTRGSPSKPCDK